MSNTYLVNDFNPSKRRATLPANRQAQTAAAATYIAGMYDTAGAWRLTHDGKLQWGIGGNTPANEPWFVRRATNNDNDKMQDQVCEATFTCPTAGLDFMVLVRVDNTTKACYAARYISGNLYIARFGADAFVGNLTSVACVITPGTLYRMTISASGVSPTTLVAKVCADATPNTTIATCNTTDSTAALQASLGGGIGTYSANIFDGYVTRFRRFLLGNAFTAGWAQQTSIGASTIALETITPTLGTASFTYQWQSSTQGPITGMANIASATTAIYTATLPAAGTRVWYRCAVTDATPTTVYTNVLGPFTRMAADKYVLIGDSTLARDSSEGVSAAGAAADLLGDAIETLCTDRLVTINSQAVSGAKTADFVNSSGQYYSASHTAVTGNSITKAIVMLGNNDARNSVSAATFSANLDNIITWLRADGVTTIYLCYPRHWNPIEPSGGTTTMLELMYSYFAVIDSKIGQRGCRAGTKWEGVMHLARRTDGFDPAGLHSQDEAYVREMQQIAAVVAAGENGLASGAGLQRRSARRLISA